MMEVPETVSHENLPGCDNGILFCNALVTEFLSKLWVLLSKPTIGHSSLPHIMNQGRKNNGESSQGIASEIIFVGPRQKQNLPNKQHDLHGGSYGMHSSRIQKQW
jgi:hypothetical protein